MSKKYIILIIIAVLAVIFWYIKWARHYPRQIDLVARPGYWGLTYSSKFAKELGLDWRNVYLDVLDDLQVKYIRLPIYWDDIEQNKGQFDFSEYDYMIAQGEARNVNFIFNIGWRLPRWPECHTPDWLDKNDTDHTKARAIVMLETVVNRYKNNVHLIAWQLENEPLLDSFGECPPADRNWLAQEAALVKKLDSSHPMIISASGELSSWQEEAKLGDILGTTIYRVVWNKNVGYFRYFYPAWYYQLKAKLANIDRHKAIISELQTEPWVPRGNMADLSPAEVKKSFDLAQFRANLQYAINVDFGQAYLWGVEWWYLEKQFGRPEYWQQAREIFRNN